MKTKSIAYLEKGGAKVVEVEVPEPGPGEVQVRGAACGICAWDLNTFRNGSAAPYAAPPGHEGVGYVSKLGAGVKEVAIGARVAGGGFTGFANFKAADLRLIPTSSLADEHWIVEPAACVVNGHDRCEVMAGQRTAVIGAGFMGLMLIQILGRSPLHELIVLDINAERLQLARRFGATRTLDVTKENMEERAAELKALGLDTVVDTSGMQPSLDLATKIAKRGGRIVLFGWLHGQGTFPGDAWHIGGYTVVNASPAAGTRDTMLPAIRLIEKGIIDLRPLVTHVVPIEEFPALLERVVQKKEPRYIKGVVRL